MTTAELKPRPKTPSASPSHHAPPPTHDQLVMALLDLDGDIHEFLALYPLSADQFLAFAADPKVLDVLTAYDALNDRRWLMIARKQQETAATHLTQALEASPGPVESRRTATALVRLAATMLKNPAPRPTLHARLTQAARAEDRPEGRSSLPSAAHPTSPPTPPPAAPRPQAPHPASHTSSPSTPPTRSPQPHAPLPPRAAPLPAA